MTRAAGARAECGVATTARAWAVAFIAVGAMSGCAANVERPPEAPLHSATFAWVEDGDSARAPSMAGDDSTSVLAVVRFHVDDTGALRRYDYAPVSASGDWVDELTLRFDADGRAISGERRASTFYTTCQPVVHVEERFVAAGSSLVRDHRVVRDSGDAIVADSTCADAVASLGSLPREVDSLVVRRLIPRNWRALAVRARAAPRNADDANDSSAARR